MAGLWYDGMMWCVVIILLALGLGTGCDNDTSPEGDVYSYNVDEIATGLFGAKSPTMTMNDWYMATRAPWVTAETYDSWTQREKNYLYKDEALKTPFAGSDILNENTVIYCNFSFNGQGKKTGEITGTITLSNIPHLAATKVYINGSSFNGYPNNWWNAYRKIDMSSVTDTSAMLHWSLPVYETFKSNSQATFSLFVLPGDSLSTYTVSVSTQKTISGANANVGDLGTVNIRGVTISGTINVTCDGQPVPYVEIFARDEGNTLLGTTCLFLPEPNAAWSLTFGSITSDKTISFQVFGYLEKNEPMPIIDKILTNPIVTVTVSNQGQGAAGIVLDVGDW
jgi:hypothetical protein